jgi:hypothetical protein
MVFKSPCNDQQQKARLGQMPSFTNPVPRVAGESHPRNNELIPRKMNRDGTHIPYGGKIELGQSDETHDQRSTGTGNSGKG